MKVQTFILKRRKTRLLICWLVLMVIQLPQVSSAVPEDQETIRLEEAFHRIGQKYDVYFNYDRSIASNIKVEYEEDKHRSLEEALEYVLKNTSLGYRIFDQRFVVVFQNSDQGIESLKEMIGHVQGFVDERETVKKQEVHSVQRLETRSIQDIYRKRLVFGVSGSVVDDSGEPLIGVNIQVKGTNKGTATDFEGRFSLEDIDENSVLVVSYIGYQTQEVTVGGKSNLTITMLSDSQLLDEVVVVGYGTQKKINLTGSVANVDFENINNRPATNSVNALAGIIPGLSVIQGGGQPGKDQGSIIIRGIGSINANAEPLIVIDGVTSEVDIFAALSPYDIKEISILKDASASAIYGSRAANGVVLVTTKDGLYNGTQIKFIELGT